MDAYGFLGKGLKFPLQIDKKTGFIAMSGYEEDIRESIWIILNTYKGERVMHSDFGTTIADYIFDSRESMQVYNLSKNLEDILTVQEPRIRDVEVTVDSADPADRGTVVFSVSYTIRSTNNRYNHVYPFYMDEGNLENTII